MGSEGDRLASARLHCLIAFAYARETLFATGMGVVLVLLVLPWSYIFRNYVKARSEPWSGPGKGNVPAVPKRT
jgi:hypothetical protein